MWERSRGQVEIREETEIRKSAIIYSAPCKSDRSHDDEFLEPSLTDETERVKNIVIHILVETKREISEKEGGMQCEHAQTENNPCSCERKPAEKRGISVSLRNSASAQYEKP